MYTNSKLAKSVRLALLCGAGATAFGGASVAVAQDAEPAADRTERIQVTGSRLQRTDLETSSPVTIVGRDEIDAGGFSNLGELLTTLNQADALGLTNLTSDTNGNDGTQTISLRGIGSSRTLVLVDGRRWLALGGGQVDISQIPMQTVDRIEVLADGASAIYGSDAIAGVINIITRNDFEGAEAEVRYSQSGESDGENLEFGVSLGARNDRSSIFFNINKVTQKAIGAGDRDISAVPLFGTTLYQSAFGEHGIFTVSNPAFDPVQAELLGDEYTVPARINVALDPSREDPSFNTNPGARTRDDFGGLVPFNFAPQNYLLTPYDRLSMFLKADHQITDSVRGFAQFTYNQRKSDTEIAAVPITNFFSGPQWNIPISEDNIFNPFGEEIQGSGFRMSPAGPRARTQDYDTYFGTVGFDGDFVVANRPVVWDIAYSRGESSRHNQGFNYVNLLNLRNGLGPSFIDENGDFQCGTADAPIAGCVPVNFFNGVTGMTDEMVDYLTYTQHDNVRTGTTNLSGNFATDLFELPAGYIAMAAGFEHRTNTFSRIPDSIVSAGFGSDNFVEPTTGEQDAEEYYVELAVPVLRDVTLAESFDLSLAVRRSEFTNSGLAGGTDVSESFDNTSYKVGFTWKPHMDLMVRGNWAETFRAPSVSDLFAGGSESFGAAVDLCSNSAVVSNPYGSLTAQEQARCDALTGFEGGVPQQTSQIRQLLGGNPGLQPESGETTTLGIVYNPSWFEGFDVSVDWWKIELEDVLSSVAANTIVSNCVRDADDASCAFIERFESTGEIQTIRRSSFNLASVEIEGIDVNANYRFETQDWGRFAFSARSTYTMSAKTTLGSLSEANSVVGQAIGAFSGPTWRIRSNFGATWLYNDWSVNWAIRHTSSLTESCVIGEINAGACNNVVTNSDGDVVVADSFNRIGTVFYHDLSASYALPWDATVRVGARNLFRKDPPLSLTAFANSFLQSYDIPGGQYFVSYRQSF